MTPAMTSPPYSDRTRACADPECGGTAEPEQDGDHRFHECRSCGYAFAWHRVTDTGDASTDPCSAGIPENVRRTASGFAQQVLAEQGKTEPPLLQIGRRNG